MKDSRYQLAEIIIQDAAQLLPSSRSGEIAFQEKHGHQDIVSCFDRKIEEFLTRKIRQTFPEDCVIGEEIPQVGHGEWTWYLDPIDGTSNFVSQRRNYAISIGCCYQGKPMLGLVYDVAADVLYQAYAGCGAYRNGLPLPKNANRTELSELFLYTPLLQQTFFQEHSRLAGMLHLAQDVRAVRSLGSVALELCALAAGEADLFITACSNSWDHNAARVILEETGGALCSWDGKPLPVDGSSTVLAASGRSLLQQVSTKYFTEA